MKANILTAVINIVKTRNVSLQEEYVKANRANSMGDALEKYVVDSFANAILEKDETKRTLKNNQVFSLLGNHTNPTATLLKSGTPPQTMIF